MAGGGLAALAFVPQGYTQGAQAMNALQNQDTDQAGQAAFGRWLQTLAGGTAPTAPTMPFGPQAGPPGAPPGMPGIPQGLQSLGNAFRGFMSPPPAVGGPGPPPPAAPPMTSGGGGPQFYGAPPPMAPAAPMGGGPPMQPSGQGAPAMGGPPSGPMDWRQVAGQIARSNPGIRPEALAAAVSRALPLMTADSQQQWRAMQLQMQQERINQGGERLDLQRDVQTERERSNRAREAGQAEGRQERQREFDTQEARRQEALDFRKDKDARDFAMKERAARDKVHSLQAQQDSRLRAQAVREWQASYNAFDKYMRNRINAQTTLGAKDKTAALKEMDAAWAQAHQEMEEIRSSTPAGQDELRQTGKDLIKQGEGTKFGPRPEDAARPPMPRVTAPGKPPMVWNGQQWVPEK